MNFIDKGLEIIRAAENRKIQLRILGALAFSIHCPKFGYIQRILNRTFSDLDFASYKQYSSDIASLFADMGYTEDFMIRRLYGTRRLVFNEVDGNGHCDVFLDKLYFCHEIPFVGRLENDHPTVPLAELLLEKMQIVRIERKDLIDTIMLVREHDVGLSDRETINAARIASLCSADWGLWKTLTMNFSRASHFASDLRELSAEDQEDLRTKIQRLQEFIDREPKTVGWKLRARIGEKVKWYEDVEEISDM
jgi:hypothetical protein